MRHASNEKLETTHDGKNRTTKSRKNQNARRKRKTYKYLGAWKADTIKQVNLASLVCNMDYWLSCRVFALQSVVVGSISSGGDHGIYC